MLNCFVCGLLILDTPTTNAEHGRGAIDGYGYCWDCYAKRPTAWKGMVRTKPAEEVKPAQ